MGSHWSIPVCFQPPNLLRCIWGVHSGYCDNGGISVNGGVPYVLFLSTVGLEQDPGAGSTSWGWLGSRVDVYPGGDFVFSNDGDSFLDPWDSFFGTGNDLAFVANISDFDGSSPDRPFLPVVPSPGVFEFPNPLPRRWFDPPLVSQNYNSISGPGAEFLSFELPPGYMGVDLIVGGVVIDPDISSGIEYFFLSDYGLDNVTEFSLAEIFPLVDAADPTAFPTFLDFTPGAASLMMKPVPGPLPLLGGGAAFAFSRKLRKRIKLSSLSVA